MFLTFWRIDETQVGLQPGYAVCIIGFNSPEWFISDLAAIYAGYVAFGRKGKITMVIHIKFLRMAL